MDEDVTVAQGKAPSLSFGFLGAIGLHEFIRYFFASAVGLGLDIGLLVALTEFFLVPYWISAPLAFLAGAVAVYILSVFWVFENRSVRDTHLELFIFISIGAIGLLINQLVLYIGTGVLAQYYLVSKIANIGLVFSWNFGARKYFLFSKI